MKYYDLSMIDEIAQALASGQVLAFPTDTVYGIGSIYGNKEALSRLKNAKHRPETKAIPMMASSLKQAEGLVSLTEREYRIAENFLPGALTMIVQADQIDREFINGLETAALRVPDAPWLLKVIEKAGAPLMVSSANLSGMPAALTAQEAERMLPGIDGIVAGTCDANQASTIIDCTGGRISLLREGPVAFEELLKIAENNQS